MRIYLDVCCLSRPFDDHTQGRVRLESEAVLTILGHDRPENWELLNSEIIDIEISKIKNDDKKQKIRYLSSVLQNNIIIDGNIEERATEIRKIGFKPFDALHIACAEAGKADVFLTTDDHLLGKALRKLSTLKVRVENPVKWLMEVIRK